MTSQVKNSAPTYVTFHPYKKKIKNSYDFFERQGEEGGFYFLFANAGKVDLSPEPFGGGSEIHTIVTYDPKTHFDVDKRKFG